MSSRFKYHNYTKEELEKIKSLKENTNTNNNTINNNNKISREKRKKVPQPQGSKSKLLPEQPCAMMLCGLSKSGKTTLLKNMLTDNKLLGNYYDMIIMFSPTAECDSTITSSLKLPDENIITNFTEDDLKDIIEAQRKLIKKKGYNKVARENKILFIFDDCISHRKFLRSKTMIDLTATVRHLLISVVFLIQSYRMVARACRINLRGIAFFESNRNETDVLCEEEACPQLKKNEFRKLIHYANNEPYSFLWINKDRPTNERYFKKFDEILYLH